jgi:hypothetical protein
MEHGGTAVAGTLGAGLKLWPSSPGPSQIATLPGTPALRRDPPGISKPASSLQPAECKQRAAHP